MFFSNRVLFLRHCWFTGRQRKGEYHLLFHSTTSTRLQTFRHLFATLHVRWISRIFNRNAFFTRLRWDFPPYWITIWLINWWCSVCLFTWWFDSRFLLQQWEPVDLNRIGYHPCITCEPISQACWCDSHPLNTYVSLCTLFLISWNSKEWSFFSYFKFAHKFDRSSKTA